MSDLLVESVKNITHPPQHIRLFKVNGEKILNSVKGGESRINLLNKYIEAKKSIILDRDPLSP